MNSKDCTLVRRSTTMPCHSNQPENKWVQQKAVVQLEMWTSVVKKQWHNQEAEAAAQVYRRWRRYRQMGGGNVTRGYTTTSPRKIGGRRGCWRSRSGVQRRRHQQWQQGYLESRDQQWMKGRVEVEVEVEV